MLLTPPFAGAHPAGTLPLPVPAQIACGDSRRGADWGRQVFICMETEGPQFVRKHWSFIILYCILTSVAIGFCSTALLIAIVVFRNGHPIHQAFHIVLWMMGAISVVMFTLQFIGGPFVLSRDVICGKCHKCTRLDRNPLMGGKFYRVPKCECGGDFEPACFWRLESHDLVS